MRRMLMRIWSPGDCANHLFTEPLLFSGKASVLAGIKQTRVRMNTFLPVLPYLWRRMWTTEVQTHTADQRFHILYTIPNYLLRCSSLALFMQSEALSMPNETEYIGKWNNMNGCFVKTKICSIIHYSNRNLGL